MTSHVAPTTVGLGTGRRGDGSVDAVLVGP